MLISGITDKKDTAPYRLFAFKPCRISAHVGGICPVVFQFGSRNNNTPCRKSGAAGKAAFYMLNSFRDAGTFCKTGTGFKAAVYIRNTVRNSGSFCKADTAGKAVAHIRNAVRNNGRFSKTGTA